MRLPPTLLARPSWRVLGLVAAATLVLVGVGVGAWLWSASQQQRAAVAYAEVLTRLENTASQPPSPEARAAAVRELEATLATYPSSSAAARAAYTLGNLRYAERDYARARAAYEVAVARSSSRTLRTLAHVALGYTWEAEGNFSRAIDVFQASLNELKPTDFQYEELLVDLARVQERAGRRDDAIASYRRVLREVPKGARTDDVLTRLASLGAAP
jgi:tetratricopeptide (TPR) repeat protein